MEAGLIIAVQLKDDDGSNEMGFFSGDGES